MPPNTPALLSIFFLLLIVTPALSIIPDPNPDPATIQPLELPPSPPATIPAFPEQANVAACPLDLPDELFHRVSSACPATGELRRGRCCPVLASWLYSAYSSTALGTRRAESATAYDMPLLPDDSETCVDDLGRKMRDRGIRFAKPNETCDLVYCYCGIRLHPLSCPRAFSVDHHGKLVGNDNVVKLEKDCLSSSTDTSRFPGLGACSKCMSTLQMLNHKKALHSSKSENRTTKMHNKDCQLMGLTWLLAKNRPAYIHTVTWVLRAIMASKDGSDPQSCTLSSDGMPLAVDSSEFSDQSSSVTLQASTYLSILLLSYLCASIIKLLKP